MRKASAVGLMRAMLRVRKETQPFPRPKGCVRLSRCQSRNPIGTGSKHWVPTLALSLLQSPCIPAPLQQEGLNVQPLLPGAPGVTSLVSLPSPLYLLSTPAASPFSSGSSSPALHEASTRTGHSSSLSWDFEEFLFIGDRSKLITTYHKL